MAFFLGTGVSYNSDEVAQFGFRVNLIFVKVVSIGKVEIVLNYVT